MDIEKIVDTYYKKIYKLSLFYLKNHQDAEDAVQQIFTKILEKQLSFKEKSHVYTWLYRIAVNTLLNMIRRKNIVQFLSFKNDTIIPDNDRNPADQMEKDETRQIQLDRFENSLHQLSHREKTALFLFHYEKMKQKEIAEIMQTSLSAVESLVHKAKKKIKLATK